VDVLTYLLKFHSLVEDKATQEVLEGLIECVGCAAVAGVLRASRACKQGTDLGSNPSCVILAEASLNSSGGAQPAQVLATLASTRPRLVRPLEALAAADGVMDRALM
jgi:hypothetical protein